MTWITLNTPDGPMGCFEAHPAGGSTKRGAIVVIQEAFGVNDHVCDIARCFGEEGWLAVAPELFHRCGGGVVPYDDFSAIIAKFEGLSDAALLMDVDATLDHLRGVGIGDASIGIVGFCMGGRVSFLVSSRRVLGAGVGFYGGGIVSGRFPQFPPLIEEATSMPTPWLGLFGDLDQSIPVADVERLREALTAAPADCEVVRYPDAGHGFHCDARPENYHKSSALDAWARTEMWFDKHLQR